MDNACNNISREQEKYYSDLYGQFGASVDAVASGKQIYKNLRYQKLSSLFEGDTNFSLHDVGVGLGHYYDYLKDNFPSCGVKYSGSEVVDEFYRHCTRSFPECSFYLRDIGSTDCHEKYDYLVFGGTFYHQCEARRKDWESFMFNLLEKAFAMANKGILFNVITQYCDFYEKGLYYCDLSKLLDFINDKLSRFFVIDHSYPLYEATIKVYKSELIKKQYAQDDFAKYFK